MERQADGAIDHDLEQLRAPLMRFFVRRLGDRAAAEDLTQDVFARMLATAGKGRVDNPEAFVFQIALNLLRDRARRARTRSDSRLTGVDPHRMSELTHEYVEDRTPERVLEGKDDVAAVIAALNELSDRTRDIYILFRLEKLGQQEIATLFGISRSTVEKEVMRATLHLAVRFGKRR